MIHFLLILLAFLLTLGISWWSLAYFSSRKWEGSIQFTLEASPTEVYALLTDLNRLPERRKEVEKIEILQPTAQGQLHWREIARVGAYAEFELIRYVKDAYWEIRMLRSSFGLKGTWIFQLEQKERNTLLTITETSQADHFWIRGLMQLAGRNATLKQEKKMLQKAFG
jgi:hypothetical protein